MSLFSLKNVSFSFPEQASPALSQLSFDVQEADFILILGRSGSGKSLLTRLLAGLLTQSSGGVVTGDIFYKGRVLSSYNTREYRAEISFISQDPSRHFIFPTLNEELRAILENLGLSPRQILRRTTELSSFFGLGNILHAPLRTLSGGELQKAALTSALASAPQVLILDEPTSELSPPATRELVTLLSYLNQEHGTSIILASHQTEFVFAKADRILCLEHGRIISDKPPRETVIENPLQNQAFLPVAAKLYRDMPPVLCLKEAIKLPHKKLKTEGLFQKLEREQAKEQEAKARTVLEIDDLCFAHGNTATIKKTSLSLSSGTVLALCGENGAGKSTLLRLITGELRAQAGSIKLLGQEVASKGVAARTSVLAYLPQHFSAMFTSESLEEELALACAEGNCAMELAISQLSSLLGANLDLTLPFSSLSSGYQHAFALVYLLALSPRLLLLDEPSKACDPELLSNITSLIREQASSRDLAVLLVTQDISFAEQTAEFVALMTNGKIIDLGTPGEVFSGNLFYTSPASRAVRIIGRYTP